MGWACDRRRARPCHASFWCHQGKPCWWSSLAFGTWLAGFAVAAATGNWLALCGCVCCWRASPQPFMLLPSNSLLRVLARAAANCQWFGLPRSPLASHPEVSSDRAPPAAVSASTTQVFSMAAASLERWQTGNAQSWQCSSSCAARLTTERNLTCAGVARGRAGAPQQAQVGVGLSPAGHDTAEGL